MPVGSKWKLFIPSDLAYGDRGAGGAIPGGAALIFEIELLDIVHQ
jgi:FKBP-type peptidyl-prolyl cis-trans isomerase FklB